MTAIFIVSAPSGSGKSTLVRRLLETDQRLVFSISYTTREPRGKERDGESYHFISRADFERMMRQGEFLECAEVYSATTTERTAATTTKPAATARTCCWTSTCRVRDN
jgi:guanylate kinase